jgi:peptidoglycan/LPS O-acetylase OafA/YrhL
MKDPNLPNKDISSVGMLRGIAAVMVCFFHFTWGSGGDLLPQNNILMRAGLQGWMGVEIFFVISGFIIPYSMFVNEYSLDKVFIFLKKRIIRIEPPYLISAALTIVLGYVSMLSPYYRGKPFHPDWLNVLGHVAYLNAFTGRPWLNPVYWTLALEFQYYLLIAFLYALAVSSKRYYRLIFFAAFACTALIAPKNDSYIFYYACNFLAGIVLFQFYCRIVSGTEFLLLLLATCGVLFYRQGLTLSLLTAATVAIILFVKTVPAWLKWLGTISYSLYLLHAIIGGRIMNLTEALVHSQSVRGAMVFVALAVSVICSALYYRFIEKPFKSRAAMIKYDQPPVIDPAALSPAAK